MHNAKIEIEKATHDALSNLYFRFLVEKATSFTKRNEKATTI
jgi:hypothetical protein